MTSGLLSRWTADIANLAPRSRSGGNYSCATDIDLPNSDISKGTDINDDDEQEKVSNDCDSAYSDICILSPPPDLDCGDIPDKNFKVGPPDPHNFDGDSDGIDCET